VTKIILSVFIGLDIIPAKFCTSTTPPSVNLTLKTKTNQSKETPKIGKDRAYDLGRRERRLWSDDTLFYLFLMDGGEAERRWRRRRRRNREG
jgi:hypothetical protein